MPDTDSDGLRDGQEINFGTDPTVGDTDDEFLLQDKLEYHILKQEETISETQRVYTVGEDTPCLPQGEYEFYGEVTNDNQPKSFPLIIRHNIDEKGHTVVVGEEG